MTFGELIANARKQVGLSQKDVASRIKKEDGSSISPQYLNDLERNRRNPPSESMLRQLAQELQIAEDYVFFVAGQFPEDLRAVGEVPEPDTVQAAFRAFRRVLREHEE
jgi:transcriptional regulator with XRE-family HTH domain